MFLYAIFVRVPYSILTFIWYYRLENGFKGSIFELKESTSRCIKWLQVTFLTNAWVLVIFKMYSTAMTVKWLVFGIFGLLDLVIHFRWTQKFVNYCNICIKNKTDMYLVSCGVVYHLVRFTIVKHIPITYSHFVIWNFMIVTLCEVFL